MARALHRLGLFPPAGSGSCSACGSSASPLLATPRDGPSAATRATTCGCPGPTARRRRTCSPRGSRRSRTAATRSSSTRRPGRSPTRTNKQAIEASYKQLKTAPARRERRRSLLPAGRCADQQGQADGLHPGPARRRRRRAHPGDRRECPRRRQPRREGRAWRSPSAARWGASSPSRRPRAARSIGLVAAMIILAFTFGTLVAMGLPIVSAVLGLAVGLSLITLLGHGVTVPTIAPTLATMIGLGVGIDYALFLVSRHRDNRKQGMELHESIAMAVATSGQRDRLRRNDRRDRAPRAPRRRDSAGDGARLLVGRRGRDRRARRPHAAAGGARARRARTSSRSACPRSCGPRRRMSRAGSGAAGRAR